MCSRWKLADGREKQEMCMAKRRLNGAIPHQDPFLSNNDKDNDKRLVGAHMNI